MSVFYKNTRRVLSYDVLRQQKTGYDQRGCVRGLTSSPAYNVDPSPTLRRRLVRTMDPAVSAGFDASVAALFFTFRDSYG